MRSSCASACLSNWNTLMATSRSANGSRARYTLLVAPLPISFVTGYLPMFMGRFSCPCERSDLLEELGLFVRLAEVGVHAEFGGPAAVLRRRARGDDDDRDLHGARVAAHIAREVEAVHARHLDVDQHHGRPLFLQLLERIHAVARREHPVALALEEPARD